MKIFVIGKKNFLYWDDHIKDAFENLGHIATHFQINNRPAHIQFIRGLLKGLLGKQRGNKISDKMHIKLLKNKLESFKPDLIFFTSAMFIPIEFYEAVNSLSLKPKVFAWEGDGGANNERFQNMVPYIDVLFESEKSYVNENKLGFKKIVHLPFAANPNVHKDYGKGRENKSYFCGAWTKDRDETFSKLTDYKIVFRGWNWDRLSNKSTNFDIKLGTVDIKDQVKDYNLYYSVINKHQEINHISALNMRTFEAPACGALLINDYRQNIEDYFIPGEEIVVFKDIDDLKKILKRLDTHPEEFDKIRKNGYQRVLAEHTYEHRMQRVVDIYNEL